MIERIEIVNFLSHKITKLDLSPGVNVIVGPTDSGKSAIIRALRWLIINRPMGDSVRSSWGGTTAVSIRSQEGTVTRVKGDDKNRYLIDDQRFDAVKSDVPEEVVKVLDLTEVNLQTQFESHFLLSKSPGEVAQHFNKVAHLDKIDSALSNIQKWLSGVSRKLETDNTQLENYNQQLLRYKDIDEIETKLFNLEQIESQHSRLKSDINTLDDLVETLSGIQAKIDHASFLKDLDEGISEVIKLIDEQRGVRSRVNDLTEFLEDYDRVDREENHQSKKIENLEQLFHKELKGICPLCGQVIE